MGDSHRFSLSSPGWTESLRIQTNGLIITEYTFVSYFQKKMRVAPAVDKSKIENSIKKNFQNKSVQSSSFQPNEN